MKLGFTLLCAITMISAPAFAADKAESKPEAKAAAKSDSKAKTQTKAPSENEKLATLKELSSKHKFHEKTESTGDLEIKLTKHLNKLIKEKYEEIKALEHDLKQIDNKAQAPKGAPTPTHLRDNVDHVKEQIERKHGEHYTR